MKSINDITNGDIIVFSGDWYCKLKVF